MALQNANNSNAQLLKAKINNLHKILSLFLAKFRGAVLNMGYEENPVQFFRWLLLFVRRLFADH